MEKGATTMLSTEEAGVLTNYDFVARRAMESLFRTLENFSEGTIVVDAQARVVWINQRYATRFGFEDPQKAIGLDCEKVVPNSLMREVVETGKPILLDLMETRQDPMIVIRLPILDDEGNCVGAVGFALFDELKTLTPLVARYDRIREELASAHRTLEQTRRAKYTFASFIGNCSATLEVKRLARLAAQSDAPTLLLGETGTGKELLTHAIHAASSRATRPLVSVNVAAIPDTLLEVEFFGAAPGAYTGAERKGRKGKFELADGGTLFLDEIGDMPLILQSKLLRAIQEQEIEPIGSNRIIRVDVRIIAATSADLPALVAAGKFRADLYYRLNVLPIPLPPLRERQLDLLPLVYSLLDEICSRTERHVPVLTQAALQLLGQYHWPGNVRQLRNVLERMVVTQEGREVDEDRIAFLLGISLPSAPPAAAPAAAGEEAVSTADAPGYADAMARFEAQYLARALGQHAGNVASAAASVGLSRAAFYKKLSAHKGAGLINAQNQWAGG